MVAQKPLLSYKSMAWQEEENINIGALYYIFHEIRGMWP
jgi:hypothetical protein